MDYSVITASRIPPSGWPILFHCNNRNHSLSIVRLRFANRTYRGGDELLSFETVPSAVTANQRNVMDIPAAPSPAICQLCQEKADLDFDFTMAFQPIVDCSQRTIFGYEALVRGINNEPAQSVIARVNDDNRYRFDQLCRIKAIALAARLDMRGMLSINFLPNAVYRPERCIRTTLQAARERRFSR